MKKFKKIYNYKKKRAIRIRKKIKNLKLNRLIVHKTCKHIYTQILSIDQKEILVSASTNEKNIKNELNKNNIYTGNIKSAKIIGKIIAERSINKGIKKVYLDRSGSRFKGRIKELAKESRINGLIF